MPAKENFFNDQLPRASNLDRAQDVQNSNLTSRYAAIISAGVETGLTITVDLPNFEFDVSIGRAFSSFGELVAITSNSTFNPANPAQVDTQTSPEPTPQSTGNTDVPFAEVATVPVDTFVLIKYLRTTDTSVLPDVVPGSHFEYPKLDDGFEVVAVASEAAALAEQTLGAVFLGHINKTTGAVSSSFLSLTRLPFAVNIGVHSADPNAHHDRAHQHTVADQSAITDGDGDVLIGADGDGVKIGGVQIQQLNEFTHTNAVVRDISLVSDINAMLPGGLFSNIVIFNGAAPDQVQIRELRDGERLFINGRLVKQISAGANTVQGS